MTRLDWLKKIKAVPNKNRIDLIADIIDVLYFDAETGTYDPDKEWGADSIEEVARALSLCDLIDQTDYTIQVERTTRHQVTVSHWSKAGAAERAEMLSDEEIVQGDLDMSATYRVVSVAEITKS